MARLQDKRNARTALRQLNPARQQLTAAVDLGASKVACFIMKPDGMRRDNRTLTVAGVGYVQSKGVKGGSIVNMEEAAHAVAMAVERAEAMAGVSVSGVTVSAAGGQLASRRVAAQVPLGPRPITDSDLSRAIYAALQQSKFAGRRPIHLLPIGWSVDGAKGVKDPRNMIGRTLGLELCVVTMSESAFRTLGHCLELAHLNFEGAVAAPFASALSALDEDELELGCICIDMGGDMTSTAVFTGGSLVHVDSLAVGGRHVTQDIARALSTSLTGAERIKTLHGSCMASSNEDREVVEAPPRGDDPGAGPTVVPRSMLKGVIQPRVEETLELVRERLKATGLAIDPGVNVVLIGGASQLNGVRETAQKIFDRSVRVGRPKRVPHLADAASGPAFCAAAGVLQRAAFGPREAVGSKALAGQRSATRDAAEAQGGVVTRSLLWLRENL